MRAYLRHRLVGMDVGRQARVNFGSSSMRQDGLRTFARVTTPDTVNVHCGGEQQFDRGVFAGHTVDPLANAEYILHLLVGPLLDARIDQL